MGTSSHRSHQAFGQFGKLYENGGENKVGKNLINGVTGGANAVDITYVHVLFILQIVYTE